MHIYNINKTYLGVQTLYLALSPFHKAFIWGSEAAGELQPSRGAAPDARGTANNFPGVPSLYRATK